jgi:hypothetical protein
MKNLLISLSLVLASCASTSPGSVPVAEGPVARTIERVLSRTEAYMEKEEPIVPISEEVRKQVSAAILTARVMTSLPEVSGDVLTFTMRPIIQLHDAFVRADDTLEQLELEIYLEDTARLVSLFQSVNVHASLSN